MSRLFFIITVLLSVFYSQDHAFGQEDPKNSADTLHKVTKTNGDIYIGKIRSDDGREVLIETKELGKIYIPKSEIRSIELVNSEKDYARGVYVGKGVFTTRYQFTTNAFPIERGENYAVINLYGPEVHFSVADNFSVGIMSTWIGSPAALSMKYTRETNNPLINVGAGALVATSGYFNRGEGFGGLYYGMITFGTRRNNFTLSGGFAHFNWYFFSREFRESGVFLTSQPVNSYAMGGKTSHRGPIIGAASHIAINDRVSIIIDMFVVNTMRDRYIQDKVFIETNGLSYIQYFDPKISFSRDDLNFILMPAMRFQKKEHTAFQFSLSGVIGRTLWKENTSEYRNSYGFPVPQCTWYFKF